MKIFSCVQKNTSLKPVEQRMKHSPLAIQLIPLCDKILSSGQAQVSLGALVLVNVTTGFGKHKNSQPPF